MKKLVLFITLINFGITQSQNVNIPDPIFKSRLLNHTDPIIDINSDNEIQLSEAEAITGRINVSTSNLSDITGIAAFINMTEFICAETKVTNIDLSSNTRLTLLDFNDSEVTYLNIDNSIELKELYCYGNKLTSLDISNNTLLKTVFCYKNKISELNLTNNTEIETLSSFNNKISSIDLSKNTKLFALALNENLITNIDISNNPEVYILYCQDNPNLTTINLKNGNNANFIFSGDNSSHFENNPNLTSICIDDFNNTTLKNEITNQAGSSITFTDNCSTLSNEKFSTLNFSIFPNPTENNLTIESKTEILKIEIYNNIGEFILEKKYGKKINISNLSQGIYLIKIIGKNGRIETKKILKK